MRKPDQSYDVPESAPEEETSDVVRKLVKAGVSGVPVVGGPVAEMMSLMQPSIERRRDEWVEDIAHELNRVRKRVKDVEDRDIYDEEAFVSSVLNASNIAIRSHQAEKREALRNAVLNSALRNEPDEDLQAIFLDLVDRYTPWHLRILKLLDSPRAWLDENGINHSGYYIGSVGQVVEDAFTELKGNREFYDLLANDLTSAGLLNIGGLHTSMTADGMLSPRTTNTGKRFLRFITRPKEHKDSV